MKKLLAIMMVLAFFAPVGIAGNQSVEDHGFVEFPLTDANHQRMCTDSDVRYDDNKLNMLTTDVYGCVWVNGKIRCFRY